MKKILSCTAACALVVLICSCINPIDFDFSRKKLSGVSSLFIVNPTEKTKSDTDDWISISTRNLVDSETVTENAIEIPGSFVEHTRTFPVEIQKSLLPRTERAATTKKARAYKTGEKNDFVGKETIGPEKRTAVLRCEGAYCYIWTMTDEDEESSMTDAELEEFAEKFDELYQKETALCGDKYQGDTIFDDIIGPDKKVSVLLFDILNDKGQGNLLGVFDPANYISSQSGTNQMEILYVDSYYAKQEQYANGLYSTLVHEFNHMLNFANKTLKYGISCESWYTEMLSMLVEDCFIEDLDTDYYNSPEARLELFISGGYVYGFGNWQDINDTVVSCNYANAYAFGAYLARNYGGAELIHEIATNEYLNEASVVAAVNKINNLNLTFDDLLLEFSFVLVNTQAQDNILPSLNKTSSGKTGDFSFNLKAINLDKLSDTTEAKICPLSQDSALAKKLDSYGLHFYQFDNKDLSLTIEDFLLYDYR